MAVRLLQTGYFALLCFVFVCQMAFVDLLSLDVSEICGESLREVSLLLWPIPHGSVA